MNRKSEFDNQQDPYEIIRRLRAALEQQKSQLDQYELICDSLTYEKNAAIQQASHLKRQVDSLTQKIQQQQLMKSRTSTNLNLTQPKILPKENRKHFSTLSPQIIKSDIVNSCILSISSPIQSKVNLDWKSKEFVPGQIVFKKRENKTNHGTNFLSAESSSENMLENVGQFLMQDFVVISPDILELKKLREVNKQQKQFALVEYYFFNYNNLYKNRKAQYLKQVARRAFPLGARAKRRTIEDYDKFKREMEAPLGQTMGEDFFIFNLKGDFADGPKERSFLGNSNPFQALFAVCLKVPDFIPIKEEKSFQKKEQEVWMVNKVYTILTYFPFFHVHVSLLSKIHKILQVPWFKLQKQEVLSRNLQRNLTETQQNPEVNKIMSYFLGKKPEFGLPCFIDNYYFGCLPYQHECEYYIAKYACPIFFSIFAYEQMLLLLTAMFMEKTIIFVSKSESASTLCSLFLTTVLNPFKYKQHLITNCDQEKIDNIVFEFPFILVVSIKKDANFSNILKMFIDSNCDRFKGFNGKDETGPLIMVDIDSNSIFYDSHLNSKFEQLIVSPSQQLRQAYLEVNAAVSKSFTFPRKMPVQMMGKSKNFYQKNQQERKKLLKEYQQKIDNNTSKWPTYHLTPSHQKVFNLLTEYIRSFSIAPSEQYKLIMSTANNGQFRKEAARRHLHNRHPFQEKLVDVLVDSQLFADYLDQLQKQFDKKR